LWFQIGKRAAFHTAFSLVMNDVRALFRLNGIVLANFHKRFNDVRERIKIVVVNNQIVELSNFLFEKKQLFLFGLVIEKCFHDCKIEYKVKELGRLLMIQIY